MKLIISQPMDGKNNELIRQERETLIHLLEADGHKIINSIIETEPDLYICKHPALYYLSKSIDIMSKVDGVVFMRGWENSRGCKIEYEIAKQYELFVRFER